MVVWSAPSTGRAPYLRRRTAMAAIKPDLDTHRQPRERQTAERRIGTESAMPLRGTREDENGAGQREARMHSGG
jgi:hypothetical protein